MTDYLDTVYDFIKKHMTADIHTVHEYVYFLDWKLTLGMFIPCDENNYPIQKPERLYKNDTNGMIGAYHCGYCNYKSALTPAAIAHDCVYDEYKRREDLLVFNGFQLLNADHTESTVEVMHEKGGIVLLFDLQTGEALDVTVDGLELPIEFVRDLMHYRLELKYNW